MDLHEFINHKDISLPAQWPGGDFSAFVQERLKNYLDMVQGLDLPAEIADYVPTRLPDIRTFCQMAHSTICDTLQGQLGLGSATFFKALRKLFPEITRPAQTIVPPPMRKHATGHERIYLYRVRRHLDGPLTREEMFHIPFEERHKVATQRYSIPGLPCLYLGGSLFACWAEMEKVPFHELHTSVFWLADGASLNLIDLSVRPVDLNWYLTNQDFPTDWQLIGSTIVLWPLSFLCSIIVRHRKAPYKPEYIIPQILLQWVTASNDLDGVYYFSGHTGSAANPHRDRLAVCNVVLPARQIKANGRCDRLRRKLKMTTPQRWELLSAINIGWLNFQNEVAAIEFVEGFPESYLTTAFGETQHRLMRLAELTRLKPDPTESDVPP